MKALVRSLSRSVLLASLASPLAALAIVGTPAPSYTITDMGTVSPYMYSQSFGVSDNGRYAIGRSLYVDSNSTPGSSWPAQIYDASKGLLTGQASLADHPWAWGYSINNSGVGVGISALSTSGAGALPTMWVNGTATQLKLPAGQTVGRAYGINNNGIAVGSVGGGVDETAVIYNIASGKTTTISALSSQGSYMQTAYGISDNGLVAGIGVDGGSHNVPLVYDSNTGTMTQLQQPAYGGAANSGLAFNISADGKYVVGSSGWSTQPIIWSASTGALLVASLPSISSSGSLYDVNSQGVAVGNSGGVYSNPFVVVGGASYLIGDVVSNGAAWNFSTTTSAAVRGISETGVIVGTAQLNGIEHAFMLTPTAAVPEPASYALLLAGIGAVGLVARRRRSPA